MTIHKSITPEISPNEQRNALLILEDGRTFEGRRFGALGEALGEIVFNTSMSGYQEILTDPSYAGQIVTLTVPHIGNYGVNPEDMESATIHAAGLVVRDLSEMASNWRADQSLDAWFAAQGKVGITDVDTRALTRHIRDKGVMRALIVGDEGDKHVHIKTWLDRVRGSLQYGDIDYVEQVQCQMPLQVNWREDGRGASGEQRPGELRFIPWDQARNDDEDERRHVVVLDFGTKFSILRHLLLRGLRVTLAPGDVSAQVLEQLKPDGILLSNGPGDPVQLDRLSNSILSVTQRWPTFGICLGHQLLARAFGAETFKLPFGHRGPNQPVRDEKTGRVAMTSQNHGYAVRAETLPEDLEITEINLNDRTVEAFRHRSLPVFAVQYHPEAGPGPHDAQGCFDHFVEAVRTHHIS